MENANGMKQSKFSDGTTDIYKGKRNVTAGWRVVTPNGVTLMGHSMTPELAEKTARGNMMLSCPALPVPPHPASAYMEARQAGFTNLQAYKRHVKEQREAFAAECRIEVVRVVEI